MQDAAFVLSTTPFQQCRAGTSREIGEISIQRMTVCPGSRDIFDSGCRGRSTLTHHASLLYPIVRGVQGVGGLVAALLEALWQNPQARIPLLAVQKNSGAGLGLNAVAQANFNFIFDQWSRQHSKDSC